MGDAGNVLVIVPDDHFRAVEGAVDRHPGNPNIMLVE